MAHKNERRSNPMSADGHDAGPAHEDGCAAWIHAGEGDCAFRPASENACAYDGHRHGYGRVHAPSLRARARVRAVPSCAR